MEKTTNKEFYRRAVKVGNSSGILLPKSLLGAEVKVTILNNPENIKRNLLKILEPYMEEIRGIFILGSENKKIEVLVASLSFSKTIENNNYRISIIPLNIINKLIKEKKILAEKLVKSKPVLNKGLLVDLKKNISF